MNSDRIPTQESDVRSKHGQTTRKFDSNLNYLYRVKRNLRIQKVTDSQKQIGSVSLREPQSCPTEVVDLHMGHDPTAVKQILWESPKTSRVFPKDLNLETLKDGDEFEAKMKAYTSILDNVQKEFGDSYRPLKLPAATIDLASESSLQNINKI